MKTNQKMMDRQEFEKKYSDVELYFKSYYKYGFTFEGEAADGTKITAYRGGSSDGIYRYEVKADEAKKVTNDIGAYWHSLTAKKDGEKIFEYRDPF